MSARILVVEDEAAIRRGVVDALRAMRYDVVEAGDGQAGLAAGLNPEVDLVLLDLLLPRMDGLDVLSALRAKRPLLPVIVLTARGTEDDRVRGLKMGADDYVVKPFSARELLARVEAVLRRAAGASVEIRGAKLGEVAVDLQRREIVQPSGERAPLSDLEASLLGYLLAQRKRVVSREELLNRVWGAGGDAGGTRTVDMHVARVRAKFKPADRPNAIDPIATVRSLGYMAAAEFVVDDPAERR
ncbi:MAG TPA: response regulator transcription factor [Pirellulales bacterium]